MNHAAAVRVEEEDVAVEAVTLPDVVKGEEVVAVVDEVMVDECLRVAAVVEGLHHRKDGEVMVVADTPQEVILAKVPHVTLTRQDRHVMEG